MSRILVLEDEPTLLRILVRALEAEGHEVVTARRVGEALALAGPWALVVADLHLADGECTPVVRGRASAERLVISGDITRDDVDLHKPFGAETFMEHVRARLAAQRE